MILPRACNWTREPKIRRGVHLPLMISRTRQGGKTVSIRASRLVSGTDRHVPQVPNSRKAPSPSLRDSTSNLLRGTLKSTKSYLTCYISIRLMISFETHILASTTCGKPLHLRPDYNLGTFFSVANAMAAPSSELTCENIS